MNPKLLEAVEIAVSTAWDAKSLIAALREQGVVVTWAEPIEPITRIAAQHGAVSYERARCLLRVYLMQASQQE